MSFFTFQQGNLHAEKVDLRRIAEQFGTPSYVYSKAAFETHWHALNEAFGDYPHLICYAVKANSNLAVLNLLARLGSGFDIVSGGELERVIAAGGDPGKVVFSGVAKSSDELRLALHCAENAAGEKLSVRCINVESLAELQRIAAIAAEMGVIAPVGVRINPDVDARTHPYIATGMEKAKFGLDIDTAVEAFHYISQTASLEAHSMACHIGSQITELQPFTDAVAKVAELVNSLATEGIKLQQLDLGGGLGIDYQGEELPTAKAYVETMLGQLREHGVSLPVAIEPGRYIAGNAGVLLTRVEYLKQTRSKNFAIVDAGMNDLMRPSLYQAYHEIVNVKQRAEGREGKKGREGREDLEKWDVVGPVCESADVLGENRLMPIAQGDLLAIRSAGAYSFAMASNYNSRPRAAEVMVDSDVAHLVRKRETIKQLYADEILLP